MDEHSLNDKMLPKNWMISWQHVDPRFQEKTRRGQDPPYLTTVMQLDSPTKYHFQDQQNTRAFKATTCSFFTHLLLLINKLNYSCFQELIPFVKKSLRKIHLA